MEIQKQFISYNYSERPTVIEYIVIHDVGAVSTAKNNREYFNGGNRGASADFFVDSNNIIQLINYISSYSWAVGDGKNKYGISNQNSVSIEMCLEANLRPSIATVTNTIELVQKLMKELNIPIERVVRHYDASRKVCPKSMSENDWELWRDFKKQLIPPNPLPKTPKVNYVLEFQRFYNRTTQTARPLIEDGVCGTLTLNALSTMEKLIRGVK